MSPSPAAAPAAKDEIELDVAIVGAGPAGTAAAFALASAGDGLRIGLLEKAVPPRDKVCGGGVLRRAVVRLPVGLATAVERECRTAELHHHDPRLQFVCRRGEPIVHMVMRDRFDYLLTAAAEAAGAELFAGTAVRGVAIAGERVVLETNQARFRARFVVAADGVNSAIARHTLRPPLDEVVPAIEAEVTAAPDEMAPFLESARFDFGLVPAGYGWVFPKHAHLSIGVLTTQRGAASLPAQYRRYCEVLGLGPSVREKRRGYMIPCRPRRGVYDVPRILFAGDAAGLADPVLAEGITAGIVSGQLAAQAILEGRGDDGPVKRCYRSLLEDSILADWRVARLLARVLYDCPRLRVALLARHGQGMSELVVRIANGEMTYREAVRRPGHFLRLFMRRA